MTCRDRERVNWGGPSGPLLLVAKRDFRYKGYRSSEESGRESDGVIVPWTSVTTQHRQREGLLLWVRSEEGRDERIARAKKRR
jgi:hypothetical protein